MNSIDLLGATCSLLSTYYFIRLQNKAWFTGLVATSINGWLYWNKGIYADVMLEIIFALGMGYGWYQWQHDKTKPQKTSDPQSIDSLSFWHWTLLGMIFIALLSTIYLVLTVYTNSTIAFLDALTVSLSLAAQWLMCKKNIMTWILWFIADALYVFIYLSKQLPFHSMLMTVYLILAIIGYRKWSKSRTFSLKTAAHC
ncbi:MAG: nicotinamide mononucleotide transporter [Legionella sp.]|nr:MAG: nicotinamide mononucleotide transporter [Legionella sp.]PJD99390.1 MAG: nicotinamide mononucleotide transporter [Legionella sp.]